MHIMEDECNKLDTLAKTNGSPSPCLNLSSTVDNEKKSCEQNGEVESDKEEEQPESTKPSVIEGEDISQDKKEICAETNSPTTEVKYIKKLDEANKDDDFSLENGTEDEKNSLANESTESKTTINQNNKLEQELKNDEPCSLPPSPDEEDENSAASSAEREGIPAKRSRKTKRKHISSESDSDTPAIVKKIKVTSSELEERERAVSDYVDCASRTGLEEIQKHADKLQQEIHTLNALARSKEHEWNSIIRLKKVKEEMFLRLQRKKQVILLTMGSLNKPIDTLDWDFSSDFRFGECSVGIEEIPSTRTNIDPSNNSLKVLQSKLNAKDHFSILQQSQSNTGISLLKNNQTQLPLMMVPIVSSSPGNLSGTSSLPSQSATSSPSSIKVPELGSRDKSLSRMHRPILPKPTTVLVPTGSSTAISNNNNGQNPVIGEGRQGPILDVRSIIADYRSRHPEAVPRRGRRLKSSSSPTPSSQQLPDNLVTSTRVSGGGGILSMASLALGSGSQMRTGLVGSTTEMGDISFLLNAVGEAASRQDTSRPSSADSSRSGAPSHTTPEPGSTNSGSGGPGISFKDVLVQFAKMSQTEQRHDSLPVTTTGASKPPPYPEVTLHPVLAPHSPPHQSPSSSLLHGILTKSNNAQAQHRADTSISARPTTFSPTLARLLTAPERLSNVASTTTTTFHGSGSHVSISDLLSTSKTRNEITITPVAAQPVKAKEEAVLMEEEQEDSADRLVIDESADGDCARSRGENEDDQGPEMAPEDVPECQGCRQRAAQFVCAGCGNQWYCSRDCQVSAWDEHSEVCSG